MRQIHIVLALALLALPLLYAVTAQSGNAHAGTASTPPPVLKAFTTSP